MRQTALAAAPAGTGRARAPNLRLCLFAVVVLGLVVALFQFDRAAYFAFIDHWSLYPVDSPFIDAEYVTTQIQCWRRGIDVYVTNPCDLLGRLQNLSPLWLRLPFWPTDTSTTLGLGLVIDFSFAMSLLAFPRPRRALFAWPILLALVSPVSVYALERANQDVIMFVLVILAILLLERSPLTRIAGYCIVMLAGLLKFYPFVVMSLALRERPGRFFAIAAVSLAVLAAFILAFSTELKAMLPNIPVHGIFAIGIGANRLPNGLGASLALILPTFGFDPKGLAFLDHNTTIRIGSAALLFAAMLLAAIRLSAHPVFAAALSTLTTRESLCLTAGAAMIAGCFVAGQSSAYRGLHLLLVLPGLTMMTAHTTGRVCTVLRLTMAAILLTMFSLPINRYPGESFAVVNAPEHISIASLDWICRELMWWWIVGILLAMLLRFAAASATWRALISDKPHSAATSQSRARMTE